MFEEAWTMAPSQLTRELEDMGVQDTLIDAAQVDVRLLAALYIYVHVEAMNMPELSESQKVIAKMNHQTNTMFFA